MSEGILFSKWLEGRICFLCLRMLGELHLRFARGLNKSRAALAAALHLSKWFDMLVLFRNSSLMEFQLGCLTSFHLFSLIDSFEWFWMGCFRKNIHSVLEFFKALFFTLHFAYYTLMTFLMILSVILLSVLSVLICCYLYSKCDQTSDLLDQSWLLNLQL